jgi:hypothetical protein
MRFLGQATNDGKRNDVSDEPANQEPNITPDRLQDAPAQDKSDQQVGQDRHKKFH